MALDSDNVRVGTTGAVYVAPTATTGPTDSDGTLDAGFIDLGYCSPDGVKETIDKSTVQIRSWQNGALVREVVSEGTYSIDTTFIETNEAVLELYYGVAMDAGKFLIDPRKTGGRQSFVIDVIDGDSIERTYIPSGEITAVSERTQASGEAMTYGVTITAYADATSNVVTKWFSDLEA